MGISIKDFANSILANNPQIKKELGNEIVEEKPSNTLKQIKEAAIKVSIAYHTGNFAKLEKAIIDLDFLIRKGEYK